METRAWEEKMKEASATAKHALAWMQAHIGDAAELWYAQMRAYVLSRFLLEETEKEEDLLVLAKKSIAIVTGIPVEKLSGADKPSGCTAATAVLDKKLLLILSLSKALGICIPAACVPKIRTVADLAETVRQGVQDA